MLRRADNVKISHRRGFWTSNGEATITVGQKRYVLGKVKEELFRERLEKQMHYPMRITRIGGRHYWQFQNKFYWESEGLKSDEVHALLITQQQRKRQHIDRAQATVAMASAPRGATVRQVIPDDLKQYIWTRDQGQCRACGSTSELQYDHIIPLKMGGSNNAENLQILCGPCNRSKSAGLTTRRPNFF
ncbi:HNH endonuclease [Pseudarthrobacter sp. TAF60_1]|uniref:HNH endonuclease n=1 Tax=Pseudarthrobacter sp. TAF60_1 TaxID=3233071 RepID=UPI003F955DF5